MRGVSFFRLNGRMTNEALEKGRLVKNKTLYAFSASNYWSSTEYNSNYAWNVNFSSGNVNYYYKSYSFVVRPVAALNEERKEAWIDSFDDCCRHKKSSDNCIRYRLHYEEDLFRLAAEVESGVYKPSTSVCFCVTRPKLREVFAANFRDRIVHHWLMLKLNPLFEQRFVEQGNVSFNCRKEYGTMKAVEALRDDIRLVSKDYTDDDCWVGRFDFIGFFMSCDKEILLEQLHWFIYEKYKEADVDMVWRTLEVVVRHNPAKDCVKHGRLELFDQLPPHKTLFKTPDGKGMPIGNLTSQILLNFYMSFFDEKMTRFCEARGGRYERFVDDFTVVMKTAKDVVAAGRYADELSSSMLKISLHKDKVYIQHYSKGIKFVGYVIKYDRIYLSNRTFGHFDDKIRFVEMQCNRINTVNKKIMPFKRLNDDLQSLNSYTGFAAHTNCYGKTKKILFKYKKIYNFAFLKRNKHVLKMRSYFKIGEILYEKDTLERNRMSARLHGEA